eukprot:COSAG01_NODE_1398_length_10466_cov_173.518086_14_plen_57_part_00
MMGDGSHTGAERLQVGEQRTMAAHREPAAHAHGIGEQRPFLFCIERLVPRRHRAAE